MTPDTFNRAKLEILCHIINFGTGKYYQEGGNFCPPFDKDGFISSRNPPIGSLVSIQAAPVSPFYLAWVEDVKKTDSEFTTQWLLRSIDTGQLGWWHNISFSLYSPSVVADRPEWRWTDKQWAFRERWLRACYKQRDAYMHLPTIHDFDKDGGVTLGIRGRHGFDKRTPSRRFPNWRKVTVSQMLAFYDEQVAYLKSTKDTSSND